MTKIILHEGEFIKLVRKGNWEYVERVKGKDAAYIIPIYENQWGEPEAVFIEEFRVPFDRRVIGFPAGLIGDIDSGEDFITAAHRELTEETGFEAARMRHLVSGPSSAGLSNELIHYYLADKLTKVSEGGGDETESITVLNIPLHKAESLLYKKSEDGYLIDSKVYLGLYWANRIL